jgi:hypothetical protein
MLSAIMAVMLNVIILRFITLSVAMPSVILLSVVSPQVAAGWRLKDDQRRVS